MIAASTTAKLQQLTQAMTGSHWHVSPCLGGYVLSCGHASVRLSECEVAALFSRGLEATTARGELKVKLVAAL